MKTKIQRYWQYYRLFSTSKPPAGYVVAMADDPELRVKAQQLHATVYLDRGYVLDHHISPHGIINLQADPHQSHAIYFAVIKAQGEDQKVVAMARQITALPDKGHHSFQTFTDIRLAEPAQRMIAQYDSSRCVEISSLAKIRQSPSFVTFLLYRAMWHYSIKSGHQLWIMSCDVKLYGRLRYLFGGALTEMGEVQFYKGHDIVPIALDIDGSVMALIQAASSLSLVDRSLKKQVLKFFLKGLPAEHLNPEHLSQLEAIGVIKTRRKKVA